MSLVKKPLLKKSDVKKKFTVQKTPTRKEVASGDTWDLSTLYQDDAEWEKDFKKYEKETLGYAAFEGKLRDSAETILECLKFDTKMDRLAERLGTYAFLKTAEDQSNSNYQGLVARFHNLASNASQLASYIRPEILAIPKAQMDEFLKADSLKPYLLVLDRIVRYKKHTLSRKEEQLIAMQSEMAQTSSHTFRQLNDADLKFGTVKNEQGQSVELSHATLSSLLLSPKRSVRKAAFHQYYEVFQSHENTLAATLSGSVHADVYYAKARGYKSALDAALFPDNVPSTVYDNLIAAVRKHLPAVHQYFDLRRRKMKLSDIHHYDTYVPILADQQHKHTWDEAVNVVLESLTPLGSDYCQVLSKGLRGRWCDRYPNQGKQSGAFSCGSFSADPFILMNYKPTVLNDVFTLTHEAGHSMHSYYSAKHQPFMYYNYSIFVAEVASTFNEQLLAHHLMKKSKRKEALAAFINHEVDSIRATIVRQTMFAEFEKNLHAMAEAGEPMTVATIKSTYRNLLDAYFGPKFVIDDALSLECMRIPHFYRAFYVYKYATGLAAAIALSRRVLEGGASELKDYLRFLQSGCSKDPLDLLKDAGVDMTSPEPVDTALTYFSQLVQQLDELLT
ncbi:MAG: oligoendopeptidase F [Pirellulaceae bacterium]|nr:oligoendopeptidase F [Pirellulaceae bacterium]